MKKMIIVFVLCAVALPIFAQTTHKGEKKEYIEMTIPSEVVTYLLKNKPVNETMGLPNSQALWIVEWIDSNRALCIYQSAFYILKIDRIEKSNKYKLYIVYLEDEHSYQFYKTPTLWAFFIILFKLS